MDSVFSAWVRALASATLSHCIDSEGVEFLHVFESAKMRNKEQDIEWKSSSETRTSCLTTMEIPIQVAVRIFPHRELKDLLRSFGPTEPKKDAQAVDEGADSKDSEAQVPAAEKDNPSISETDPNGNAEQDSAADSKTIPDANGNDSGQKDYPDSAYCVQAIPISASALGLPSALPGGDPMDSIAAGLIQVGPHTVPVTHALPSSSSQEQVYHQTVFPLITLFLEGFDASVVTYGQRGQGKSYTLYGNVQDPTLTDSTEGVVQLCVRDIFSHISLHPGEFTKRIL